MTAGTVALAVSMRFSTRTRLWSFCLCSTWLLYDADEGVIVP